MTLLVFIKQFELSCFSSYQINMKEEKRFFPRIKDRKETKEEVVEEEKKESKKKSFNSKK